MSEVLNGFKNHIQSFVVRFFCFICYNWKSSLMVQVTSDRIQILMYEDSPRLDVRDLGSLSIIGDGSTSI